MKFIDALKEHIIIMDGGMGTMVQGLNLSDADFGGSEFKMLADLLAFSKPDDLKGIHLKYLQAGSNAIETNTFGASALRLQEYDFSKLDTSSFLGLPDKTDITKISHNEFAYHLNSASAKVAKEALQTYQQAKDYDGRPLFVVGCVGPSNWILSSTQADLKQATYQQIVDNFYYQVLGLIDGGADVLSYDTSQDQLELKAAIHGGQKAMKERDVLLPIIAHVTVDKFSKMQIFNTDILAVLATVQDLGIDAFGINCSIGPDLMETTVKKLSELCSLPISIMPNAGLPVSEKGQTVFKLSPKDLAKHILHFVKEYGVNIVGGCCGTNPDHIEAIAKVLKNHKPILRNTSQKTMVSGPQNAVLLDSSQGLIRIGERLNVRGSKKVREAVESQDDIHYDVLEAVVHEQTDSLGLEILDVCMDSNVVNTETTLCKVIQSLTVNFSGVFSIDSFSAKALEQAVSVYSGRPIINSISLEEVSPGVDKIKAVVGQTYQHHPIYIALCTNEEGPAKTAQAKAEIAKKIYENCRDQYGVKAGQLIVDVNAFPIGSESEPDMKFALESLKAMPLIKKIHPDIMVSIGVGNLTNGLAKKPYMRMVLTSVFIHEARQKGLDAAIINPHHYVPIESIDPGDVSLAKKIILEHDMEAFSELEEIALLKKGKVKEKRTSYDDLSAEEAVCQKIKDGFKQKLEGVIEEGDFVYPYQDALVPQVAESLKKYPALEFINDHLMKTMQVLGEGFAHGEVSLPHLLKSADVMKQAMSFIEAKMKNQEGHESKDNASQKKVIVLGTVYQDVHSIGKDLVKTLLENYGYRVVDLGVQVPLERFIKEAKEHKAVAIGMSALLVQTSNHMIDCAKMAKEAGLDDVALLIGGAPVNHGHAASVAMHGQNDVEHLISSVFYCASAMDGVNILNQYTTSSESREGLLKNNATKLREHYQSLVSRSQEAEELLTTLPRRYITDHSKQRDVKDYFKEKKSEMTMKEFSSFINLKSLFSLNWKYGGHASWQKKGMTEELLKEQFEKWVGLCDEKSWLKPQAICGIYPCQSHGDAVIIYHPEDLKKEIACFDFSPVVGKEKKDVFSAAQYFLSKETRKYDVIGLLIASGGLGVQKQIKIFQDQGDTESAWLLQGLSDRVAEDMAEYTHHILRKHMGLSEKEGTRYSPGYPGLKDIKVNQVIVDLLRAQKNISVALTEASVFEPTGTTAAVVCFHPESRYD